MQPVLPVHVVARLLLVLLLAAGVYFARHRRAAVGCPVLRGE